MNRALTTYFDYGQALDDANSSAVATFHFRHCVKLYTIKSRYNSNGRKHTFAKRGKKML